jgi:hypothetical protein
MARNLTRIQAAETAFYWRFNWRTATGYNSADVD